MPSARVLSSFLAVNALSCSSQAPPPTAVAPAPASSVPQPTAPAASSSSPPSDAGPPAPKSRKQEHHDAVDRLMGGQLTRAEERCAEKPIDEREACVDAHLAAHSQEVEYKAKSSLRSLELLAQFGNARCTAAPADKKDDCSARAINALIGKLSQECPPGDTNEGHDCIVEKVLRQLGP